MDASDPIRDAMIQFHAERLTMLLECYETSLTDDEQSTVVQLLLSLGANARFADVLPCEVKDALQEELDQNTLPH